MIVFACAPFDGALNVQAWDVMEFAFIFGLIFNEVACTAYVVFEALDGLG